MKTNTLGEYNSVLFAKYLVAYANANRYALNITKIQKLLYVAYGAYMAVTSKRLLDEHPQAWPYGPVFPKTRNCLVKLNLESISPSNKEFAEIKNNREINDLLNSVLVSFGGFSAVSLSEWSHKKGSPWDKTVKSDNFKWGKVIEDDLIKRYFDSIIISQPKEKEIC